MEYFPLLTGRILLPIKKKSKKIFSSFFLKNFPKNKRYLADLIVWMHMKYALKNFVKFLFTSFLSITKWECMGNSFSQNLVQVIKDTNHIWRLWLHNLTNICCYCLQIDWKFSVVFEFLYDLHLHRLGFTYFARTIK